MLCVPSNFFFEMSHAFSEVTSVTRDRFVRNSGFEAQIIADLRPILRVPPGQRYRGASGGLHWSGWRRKWEDVNEGVGVEFEVLFDGVFVRSARGLGNERIELL